jgi:sn-glycerol 3-phosphate transport system permease protein
MVENTKSIDRVAGLILGFGMGFVLLPLVVALVTATQAYETVLTGGLSWLPGDQLLVNIARVFEETALPGQLVNSFVAAMLVATLKCLFAFMTALAIVFFQIRWGGALFALTLVTIMLPLDLRVITTYQVAADVGMPVNLVLDVFGIGPLMRLSVLDTWFGLAAPLVAHGTGTFLFRQAFLAMPRDLPRAAVMDGAGPGRFALDILLPLSRAPLIALFIMMFLGGWTQYLWPLVAASRPDMQTAVVGLSRLANDMPGAVPDYPLIMAGALVVSAIPLAMVALLQRFIVRGYALSEK